MIEAFKDKQQIPVCEDDANELQGNRQRNIL